MARAFAEVMALPLQVTFRDVRHSDSLEARVRARADKLESFHRQITSCRVALEAPHRQKRHGLRYRVRIDLTVPGAKLVIGRHEFSDAYAAVDDAFHDAQRVLTQHASRHREVRGDAAPR